MIDPSTGKPIRGTEIVHLVAHKGRLYAGNGYWMDARGYENIPWAQVLVLDSRDGDWKVDLALGPRHLRVTALKSVTFTTGGHGMPLASPVNLLLADSDIQRGKRESNIWTRNDETNAWVKTTLPAGHGLRRSTRAFAIHRDRKTRIDRIFVAAGAPGIYSGVYDAGLPGKIRWDQQAELGPVAIRPMSFVEANGRLYASAGVSVYCRRDGASPVWEKVYSDGTREHWELGGIRGLAAVPSPDGRGESILFSHTDRFGCLTGLLTVTVFSSSRMRAWAPNAPAFTSRPAAAAGSPIRLSTSGSFCPRACHSRERWRRRHSLPPVGRPDRAALTHGRIGVNGVFGNTCEKPRDLCRGRVDGRPLLR
jgi:hypothetical protein